MTFALTTPFLMSFAVYISIVIFIWKNSTLAFNAGMLDINEYRMITFSAMFWPIWSAILIIAQITKSDKRDVN